MRVWLREREGETAIGIDCFATAHSSSVGMYTMSAATAVKLIDNNNDMLYIPYI